MTTVNLFDFRAQQEKDRMAAMDAHLATIRQHREDVYRKRLPTSAYEARLSRFAVRDEADQRVVNAARKWRDECLAGSKNNLVLVGPPGTGKTWLAAAIGWSLLLTDRVATYACAPSMWLDVRDTYGDKAGEGETEKRLMDAWCSAPVLIIDEIGAGHVTDAYQACIAGVINRRHDNDMPTIGVSNLAPVQWASVLDDRAANRMGAGRLIAVEGGSRRRAA